MWENRLFYSMKDAMRERFGTRVVKYPIDGGYDCPGRRAGRPCAFCGDAGAGEWTRTGSLAEQVEHARTLMHKWGDAPWIAYFQNRSGTFADAKTLARQYEEVLALGAVGIRVATRADLLPDDVCDLFETMSKRTYFAVELGLETVRDRTLERIDRGMDHRTFHEGTRKMRNRDIPVIVHVLYGLPGESTEDMLATARYVAAERFAGVKFHGLYIDRTSRLGALYAHAPWELMTQEAYAKCVAESIARLSPETVVERLTADPRRIDLIAPAWATDKRRTRAMIMNEMRARGWTQASLYGKESSL